MRISSTTDMRCISKFRGFTLAELMAVAVLIAMVSSIGLISTIRTFKSWAVEENAKKLFLMAKYARVYSIENQKSCFLVMDPEQKLFFLSCPNEEDEAASEEIVIRNMWSRPQTLQPHVEFEAIEKQSGIEDENRVEFRPDGTAEGFLVQVGDGKRHFAVKVSSGTAKARLFTGELDQMEPDQVDLDLVE